MGSNVGALLGTLPSNVARVQIQASTTFMWVEFVVGCLISKQRQVYIKHENELSKHQEVICQTGEEIFHLISKHREVTNLTRERVFYLYPNTEK